MMSHRMQPTTNRKPPQWDKKQVLREISQTETAIENIGNHIQQLLRNTTSELSSILNARAEESELKAYLRGLRFIAQKNRAID